MRAGGAHLRRVRAAMTPSIDTPSKTAPADRQRLPTMSTALRPQPETSLLMKTPTSSSATERKPEMVLHTMSAQDAGQQQHCGSAGTSASSACCEDETTVWLYCLNSVAAEARGARRPPFGRMRRGPSGGGRCLDLHCGLERSVDGHVHRLAPACLVTNARLVNGREKTRRNTLIEFDVLKRTIGSQTSRPKSSMLPGCVSSPKKMPERKPS